MSDRMTLEDWVHCCNCKSTNVSVSAIIADRGGVESRTFECNECGAVINFV